MARERPICFALNKRIRQLFFIGCAALLACKDHQKVSDTSRIAEVEQLSVDDQHYVINSNFPRGDVRRYGIVSDIPISAKRLDSLLDLAEKGVELHFPKGYYPINLVFKGRQNLVIQFDSITLGGAMDIIELDTVTSRKLDFKGSITLLDRLFIRNSSSIRFDKVFVRSDSVKNLFWTGQ